MAGVRDHSAWWSCGCLKGSLGPSSSVLNGDTEGHEWKPLPRPPGVLVAWRSATPCRSPGWLLSRALSGGDPCFEGRVCGLKVKGALPCSLRPCPTPAPSPPPTPPTFSFLPYQAPLPPPFPPVCHSPPPSWRKEALQAIWGQLVAGVCLWEQETRGQLVFLAQVSGS